MLSTSLSTSLQVGESLTSKLPPLSKHSPHKFPQLQLNYNYIMTFNHIADKAESIQNTITLECSYDYEAIFDIGTNR